MKYLAIFFYLSLLLLSRYAFAEPQFEIISGKFKETYTITALRNHKLSMVLDMDYSRSYPGKMMHYQSMNLCELMRKIPHHEHDVIEFKATDDFSVFIPYHFFMACNKYKSTPYLAIEPRYKWPILFNGTGKTAGPFALIWTHPALSQISDEYWIWSVTKGIVHSSIPKFKMIQAPLSKNPQVKKGYQIFVSHCSSCHNINHIGQASIGPDLGKQNNPLKQFHTRTHLKEFIRNPALFMYPKKVRMSGSSLTGLSNKSLEALIDYFQYLNELS